MWQQWRRAAGWPAEGTFHSLRHYFATALITARADPTDVQRALGATPVRRLHHRLHRGRAPVPRLRAGVPHAGGRGADRVHAEPVCWRRGTRGRRRATEGPPPLSSRRELCPGSRSPGGCVGHACRGRRFVRTRSPATARRIRCRGGSTWRWPSDRAGSRRKCRRS
jgi:hypothetical protein